MLKLKYLALAPLCGLMCLPVGGTADAAEIKALVALGMKDVLDDLRPKFEGPSGHKLAIKLGTLGQITKMVRDGEAADFVIMPQEGIDAIVKDGKATAANVSRISQANVVVFFRKGAPKPDISTPDALKRTLLAAKSITYGDPAQGGASSIHFAKVIERLGIANELKPKTVLAKAGADAGVVVAEGRAELGVNQWQVVLPVAGIENAGPLPGDLRSTAVFAAAVMNGAKEAAAAKALVDFLRTPAAAAVIKAKGMEPAT